jgi:hypothetical protein
MGYNEVINVKCLENALGKHRFYYDVAKRFFIIKLLTFQRTKSKQLVSVIVRGGPTPQPSI